jgi:hypothetical protein
VQPLIGGVGQLFSIQKEKGLTNPFGVICALNDKPEKEEQPCEIRSLDRHYYANTHLGVSQCF